VSSLSLWERAGVRAAAALLAGIALASCSSPAPKPPSAAQASAQTFSLNGSRALRRGDLNAALAAYNEALAASDSVEDFEGSGTALLNLALVHARLAQSDPPNARTHLSAAHARVERILSAPQRYSDALRGQAATRKAMLYLDAKAHGLALHWADQARAVCTDPCPLAPTLANLRALVALERGEAGRALDQASRAADLARAMGNESEHANALRLLGRASTRVGKTDEAAAALARALAIDRELGLPERIALDLMHSGENEEKRGQIGAARDFYERALNVASAAGINSLADALRARLTKRE
jgi:tetratricopeptide (TPR) repeat protein